MRVLFINENIGGHATVHHGLRRTVAQRADVEAIFLDLPAPAGLARLAGARIPGLARLDLDLQPLRAQLARSAGLARRLSGQLGQYDVVHLYTHNAGLLSTRHWRATPTVVSLDTTNEQNGYRLPSRRPTPFTPLTIAATKPFEKRVYRAATSIVANSAWAANSVRDDYNIPARQIQVLPFGIDAPTFGDGPAPGTAPDKPRPKIVFVGRSLERKGGRTLMKVHRRHFATRADLVLVTEERVEPSPGVEVINDLRPGDDRLWEILRDAAMFVFPSEIDMAPNAVIEAMMAGLPIIARPVGAIPEMVEHGTNGLLVGPDDDELAAAIGELLDNLTMRQRFGASSRLRALASYDARRSTDAIIETLRAAIQTHQDRPTSPRRHARGADPIGDRQDRSRGR